jgi:hypothetical protein
MSLRSISGGGFTFNIFPLNQTGTYRRWGYLWLLIPWPFHSPPLAETRGLFRLRLVLGAATLLWQYHETHVVQCGDHRAVLRDDANGRGGARDHVLERGP